MSNGASVSRCGDRGHAAPEQPRPRSSRWAPTSPAQMGISHAQLIGCCQPEHGACLADRMGHAPATSIAIAPSSLSIGPRERRAHGVTDCNIPPHRRRAYGAAAARGGTRHERGGSRSPHGPGGCLGGGGRRRGPPHPGHCHRAGRRTPVRRPESAGAGGHELPGPAPSGSTTTCTKRLATCDVTGGGTCR